MKTAFRIAAVAVAWGLSTSTPIAEDLPPVFAAGTNSADIYVKPPYCNGQQARDFDMRLDVRSLSDGLNRDEVFWNMRVGRLSMEYDWSQQNFCLYGGDGFSVTADVHFGNELVARAGYTVLHGEPSNPRFDVLKPKAKNTEFGAFLDTINWQPDDSFKAAIATLEAYRRDNPGQNARDLNFLLGYANKWAAEDRVEGARQAAADHFSVAAELGSPGATREVLENSDLLKLLGEVRGDVKDGKTDISADMRARILKHIGLYERADAQNIAIIVGYRERLAKAGIGISRDMIGRDPDAPPFSYAIERALNVRLHRAAKISDPIMGAIIRAEPGFSYRCEGDWCESFNGLIRFRFAAQGDPVCERLEPGRFSCAFQYRMVAYANIDMGDHPGNQLLGAMLQNAVIETTGDFRFEKGEWVLVGEF